MAKKNKDLRKWGLLLSLIGGIIIVVFGVVGLLEMAIATTINFGSPIGFVGNTILANIIAIVLGALIIFLSIKPTGLDTLVLGIILLVLGIIVFGLGGLLTIIGGILLLIAGI